MASTTFNQTAFRIRNDDGSESTATWRQAQNTNDTINVTTNFRVRFLIDEQNSKGWSAVTFNLYYSLNAAAYAAVSGSTPVQFVLSSNFADGDDCTSQLTGGVGTFTTNNNGMKETTGGATNTGNTNEYFDTEWCVTLDNAQLANNDTVALRIYNGSTAINAYNQTPTITVSGVVAGQPYAKRLGGTPYAEMIRTVIGGPKFWRAALGWLARPRRQWSEARA